MRGYKKTRVLDRAVCGRVIVWPLTEQTSIANSGAIEAGAVHQWKIVVQ